MTKLFINISERYGGEIFVNLKDYQELNPQGRFEKHGNEIREYFSDTPGDYEVIAREVK